MITLIAGGKGLIGKEIANHLWPDVLIYDLPEAENPLIDYEMGEYDAFIDCARYDAPSKQFQTWNTVIKHFKEQQHGRMILFSSIYGHKAPEFQMYIDTEIPETPIEYAIWKGGTEQAVRYLAQKFKSGVWDIQVNGIAPGGVWDKHSDKFMNAYYYAGHASMILPRNIIPVVDMLLHKDNAVNGQIITVDGGWSL